MPYCEDHYPGCDGTRLYERCWLPETDARAAVAIVHGFTEHSGRYARIAERLNSHGYAVYATDLRGHGHSDGELCFIRRFDQYLDDLDLTLDRVRRRALGKPVILFGHSMGGLIVGLYAAARQPDLRGLVLSSAVLRVGDEVFPILRRLAGVASWAFPRLRLVRLGSGYLSRDPQAAAEFRDDPLVFKDRFPVRTGAEMLRAVRRLSARMESLTLPLLILHGTGDIACNCEGSRELHRRAASADKTLHLYEGLYHAIFWEPDRERVLSDLLQWLDART
jgi:acylglycerol lipase